MLSNIIYFKVNKKKLSDNNYKIDHNFKHNYNNDIKFNDLNLEKSHFCIPKYKTVNLFVILK